MYGAAQHVSLFSIDIVRCLALGYPELFIIPSTNNIAMF